MKVEEAQKAMIEDFENNVFSLMKEYIKDILETYKIYQLRNIIRTENEQNYYFKVNKNRAYYKFNGKADLNWICRSI